MSDPTDHLDPKEATEAKLCAYLEGELSPGERAEIEQHLLANPQHRQLLADLAKTREWMRSIPRETVPMDLAEMFQGQMERSMLLDENIAAGSSVGRWPQYAMVAAIVLLVVGLGVTLFVIMSGPNDRMKNLSMAPTTNQGVTPHPVSDASAAMAEKAAVPAFNKPLMEQHAAPSTVAVKLPGAAEVAAPPVASITMARTLGGRPPVDSITADTVKSRLLAAGYHLPIDQKTLGFVVTADSPDSTDTQLREFFSRHELAFDDALAGKHGSASALAMLPQAGAATTQVTEMAMAQNGAGNNAGSNAAANAPQNQASNDMAASARHLPVAGAVAPVVAPVNEAIYVAHHVTPLQVELLNASLSADNLGQTVKRLPISNGSSDAMEEKSPATMPTANRAGIITRGQTLTITVPQLVGPGIDKINVVKVTEDGNISLPMIDPLPAAGESPAELETKIAAKYREANLIPMATVTVVPSAVATTNPTTMPTTAPATQPIAPAMKDDTVDVVVVIEKSNAASR